MSIVPDKEFQHIHRILNTNIDGKRKIMYALTAIKGIGRRFSALVCKKAEVNLSRRAGELSPAEIDKLVDIINDPLKYKIPQWFLNRQSDIDTGLYSQVTSNSLSSVLRDDLERLKKIRAHRGIRHFYGHRVRGQHTKTSGRGGKVIGVSKKK